MEKILTLNQGNFNMFKFEFDNKRLLYVRELLQLSKEIRYAIAKTTVLINNSRPGEVYKNIFKGKSYYYIVIEPVNTEKALCYVVFETDRKFVK